MSQMSTEPMPIKVEVIPVTYLDVLVEGPGGLRATLYIPDAAQAWDVLNEFVAAFPGAVAEGMRQADKAASAPEPVDTPDAAEDRGHGYELGGTDA